MRLRKVMGIGYTVLLEKVAVPRQTSPRDLLKSAEPHWKEDRITSITLPRGFPGTGAWRAPTEGMERGKL